MLKWKKKGAIFDPTILRPHNWMQEYAQVPNGLVLDDRLRIYFACRPKRDDNLQYVSRTSYIDVQKDNFSEIRQIAQKPILELGRPGTFDEFGIMVGSVVPVEDKIYAYYAGWSRLATVPYNIAIGLAISEDGGDTFSKFSEGPILGQNYLEPFILSGGVVRIFGTIWHMWYYVGTKWISHENKYEPVYRIAHATSQNGIDWKRDGIPVIPALTDDECQVSLGLFQHKDRWYSLFAHRRATDFRAMSMRSYRIGCAWSDDLLEWHRDDALAGLDVSESGWDSEMICYPSICEMDDNIYLFYCGNNFGRNGFGYAELVADE